MKDGVKQIIGKEISAVIVVESQRAPTCQMFLVFLDGTYFEIWGDTFTGAGGVDHGGASDVIREISASGGRVTDIYLHPSSPSLQLQAWLDTRERHWKLADAVRSDGGSIMLKSTTTDPTMLDEPLRSEAILYLNSKGQSHDVPEQKSQKDSAFNEFHKLWSSAVVAENYDKSAWKNIELQLINAKIL